MYFRCGKFVEEMIGLLFLEGKHKLIISVYYAMNLGNSTVVEVANVILLIINDG